MPDVNWKDISLAITATAGLITASASAWQGCNTRQIQEQHADKIQENQQAIGAIKETAVAAKTDADIAKDKAVIVSEKVDKIEKERKADK